jgi:LPPG:FO 2-phospho-L-lactate transferase
MSQKIVVLTGGVGGAKLVRGLMLARPNCEVVAIVNTGDDFKHMGLPVSPDIDTLLYTLSDKANITQGWGREGETWSFMQAVGTLGGPQWFLLGDGDLALHVMRLAGFQAGQTLTDMTEMFRAAWQIPVKILPMSDDLVATKLDTEDGEMDFQTYFVGKRCAPKAKSIWFEGAETARPGPDVLAAINDADVVLVAPSNPWLSVDPILALPVIKRALQTSRAPVVAISPLIGGKAVKGPTDKIMGELGIATTNTAILDHYGSILRGLIIDTSDGLETLSIPTRQTSTYMSSDEDRIRVAEIALAFAKDLAA